MYLCGLNLFFKKKVKGGKNKHNWTSIKGFWKKSQWQYDFIIFFLSHIKYTHILSEDVEYRRWKNHLTLKRDRNAINTNVSDVYNNMEEGKWISVNAFKGVEGVSR